MTRIVKKFMFTPIVMIALFVAVIGIKPACFFWFYQPAPPVKHE